MEGVWIMLGGALLAIIIMLISAAWTAEVDDLHQQISDLKAQVQVCEAP